MSTINTTWKIICKDRHIDGVQGGIRKIVSDNGRLFRWSIIIKESESFRELSGEMRIDDFRTRNDWPKEYCLLTPAELNAVRREAWGAGEHNENRAWGGVDYLSFEQWLATQEAK